MKKIHLIVFIILAASVLSSAQDPELLEIQNLLKDNRVSADYSFTYEGKLKCSGVITIQDPCYKAAGNGIEVYCDGTSRWTVDSEAKEVYIEAVSGTQDYLQYLTGITDLKIVNVKKEPRSDVTGLFIFNDKELDSSWVVTDLR